MRNEPSLPPADEGPLYVRWGADRSPYAIELRFELIVKIKGELELAAKAGAEIGGLLVGSLPDEQFSTLRIDAIELVRRRPEDGALYTIDPSQHGRFSEVKRRLRTEQRQAVGFFRSNVRPGLLRPAIADRTLLSNEFKNDVYAFLLIEAAEPYSALFFVAEHGELPPEPSAAEFRFNSAEFRELPEVEPERIAASTPVLPMTEQAGKPWPTILGILAIGACVCALIWYLGNGVAFPIWTSSPSALQLAVNSNRGVLRISWNHAAREFARTASATLTITDGGSRREIQLGLDELRLGQVDYEAAARRVEVSMVLNMPGATPSSQSVLWTAK